MGSVRFWVRWSVRDLRRRRALVVTLALVVALATGVGAGLGSMERWRLDSNDASFALLRMHDLRVAVRAGTVPEGELAAAARAAGGPAPAVLQERLIVPTQVDAELRGGGTVLVPGRLVGADPSLEVDTRYVQAGRDLVPADAARPVVVVEGNFARVHAVAVPGTARLAGGADVRVAGRVLSPEYFLVSRTGSDIGAEAGFAVVFAHLRTVQGLSGAAGRVNELVLRLPPGADRVAAERRLRAALAARLPGTGVDIVRRDDEMAYHTLDKDARGDQQMVDVFAWLLLAGAAFASFNLVARVVEAQRREIGVGMALGVPPSRLAVRPLLFAAEVALLGVVAGIAVGLAFNQVFRRSLQDLIALPEWRTPLLAGTYARAALLGFAVPLLAAVVPVVRAVRVPPVEAIRVGALAASGAGAAPVLRRLRIPGSALAGMPLRNLARTPRRTLLSGLGIAAVITILVALGGVFDAFDRALDTSRREALHDNPQRMVVTFAAPVAAAGPEVRSLSAGPDVAAAAPVLVLPVTLRTGSGSAGMRVELLDPDNPVWRPRVPDGAFDATTTGIVIPRRAAQDLGVGVGDTLRVEHPVRTGPSSFTTATSTFAIAGIHGDPMSGTAYLPASAAGRFGLAGAANAVEITAAGDPRAVARRLLAVEGVASVEPASALTDAIRSYLDRFLMILRITQVVALVLAVLIAFNTTTIAGEERRREHATMLAFGTPPWRIGAMSVVESAVIGFIGTVAGLVLGVAVLGWIVNVVSREVYPDLLLDVVVSPSTVGMALLLGVVAVALAPVLGGRQLRRVDIPATLRVVE